MTKETLKQGIFATELLNVALKEIGIGVENYIDLIKDDIEIAIHTLEVAERKKAEEVTEEYIVAAERVYLDNLTNDTIRTIFKLNKYHGKDEVDIADILGGGVSRFDVEAVLLTIGTEVTAIAKQLKEGGE